MQRGGRKRVGERISHGYKGMLRSSKVKRERKQERKNIKSCVYREKETEDHSKTKVQIMTEKGTKEHSLRYILLQNTET